MMSADNKIKHKKILRSDDYTELIIDSLVNTVEGILTGALSPADIRTEDLDPDVLLKNLGIPPEGESDIEYAILLANTRINGKTSPEKLASMLRDPEYRMEFNDEDWNMLTDFVEGKLKNKAGRRSRNAPFGFHDSKGWREHLAATNVQTEMQMRRQKNGKTWGVLSQIIDEKSAQFGADPVRVAAIVKKGRR